MKKYVLLIILPLLILVGCTSSESKEEEMVTITNESIREMTNYFNSNKDDYYGKLSKTNDIEVAKTLTEKFSQDVAVIWVGGKDSLDKQLSSSTKETYLKEGKRLTDTFIDIDYNIKRNYYNKLLVDMGIKELLTDETFRSYDNLYPLYELNGYKQLNQVTEAQEELSNDFIKYKDDSQYRYKQIILTADKN